MRIMVIGGGKVGYYLAKTLKSRKHSVILIEKNIKLCSKISDELDIDVVCGDATDIEVLKDANIKTCDVVAATTGKDEDNLVLCQIAKIKFKIQQTIARVNNPKNQNLFRSLGVDKTVCSTQVIANIIDWECENEKITILQSFDRGEMILVEVSIDKKDLWCDKYIKDIKIPNRCVIASIVRDEKIIYPKGDTLIKNNDKVLIIIDRKSMDTLEDLLLK